MAVVGYKNDPNLFLKKNFTSVPITVGGGGPIACIDGATRRGHNVVKYYYYYFSFLFFLFYFFFPFFPFFLFFFLFFSFLLFLFFYFLLVICVMFSNAIALMPNPLSKPSKST